MPWLKASRDMMAKDTHKLAAERASIDSMHPGSMAGRVGWYGACTLSHEPIETPAFLRFLANQDMTHERRTHFPLAKRGTASQPCNLGGTANGPSSQSGGGVCLFRWKRRWKEFACRIRHYQAQFPQPNPIIPSPLPLLKTGSMHIRTTSSLLQEPFTASAT